MESKFVQPFVDATIKVLETMAFVTPQHEETCLCEKGHSAGEVIGIVGLANEDKNIKGFMSIGFSEKSIIHVVSCMFGEEFTSVNEEVSEAVGEIANMISGQARQQLSKMEIKLQAAIPSIIKGKNLDLKGKNPIIVIKFKVDSGPFELGICMEGMD